jgi:PA-IL-like protein
MRRFAAFVLAAGLCLGVAVPALATTPVSVPARGGWIWTGIPVVQGEVVSIRSLGSAHTAPIPAFHVPGVFKSASGPEGQVTGSTCGEAYATFPDTLKEQTGPCAVDAAYFGELVGRIGATTFAIGAAGTFVAPADGILELAVNDLTLTYGDNAGAFTVLL